MKRSIGTLLLLGIAALPLAGCGGDREERGLSPAVEEAVPMDPKEMEMTEAERRAKAAKEEAAAEKRAFDDAAN
jgi:outer membrane murein-binding lipoprotein Lpp